MAARNKKNGLERGPFRHEGALNRRKFFRTSSLAAGSLALRLDHPALSAILTHFGEDSSGQLLGQIDFLNEGPVEMDTAFGRELDGRLYTSLSALDETTLVTPADHFYLRTRASRILPEPGGWGVAVEGMIKAPRRLKIGELQTSARPLGLHLMECAGNTRAAHFGMISVGDWQGVPLSEILNAARPKPDATQVLISGFDRYIGNSATSTPGASWIFNLKDLLDRKAFLATQLDLQPLSPDHGAPIRLVVPGCYGCACIKWVERITVVDDSAESTSQMLEYATRTHQKGNPLMAKDYTPPQIEHAAMPVRVEKRLYSEKIQYRVVGLLWGGSQPIKRLGIRFNPDEDYVPVDSLPALQNNPWTIWSHGWTPAARGTYTIRVAIQDPELHPKRLEAGYYARSVRITEL